MVSIEAALAHLGERQTEVHFKSRITCEFWRYCVRSTEAAFDTSSFAFVACGAVYVLLLFIIATTGFFFLVFFAR